MKFKSVFAVFNIVVLASFVFVFFMPFFALGESYAMDFWKSNWPLALLLVAALLTLDLFFIANWRLFTLLEREDWPALATYLEDLVITRGKYRGTYVRLLANAYLVLSDAQGVIGLENRVQEHKRSLLNANALSFGVARVLSGDHVAAAQFFADRVKAQRVENPDWVRWYLAFSLLLAKRFDDAASELLTLASTSKNVLVLALVHHFLSTVAVVALPDRAEELRGVASVVKEKILSTCPVRASWDKAMAKASSDIHVVVLAKSLGEAAASLYAAPR